MKEAKVRRLVVDVNGKVSRDTNHRRHRIWYKETFRDIGHRLLDSSQKRKSHITLEIDPAFGAVSFEFTMLPITNVATAPEELSGMP